MLNKLFEYFLNWWFLFFDFLDFLEISTIISIITLFIIIFLIKKDILKLFYEAGLSILKLMINPIGFIYLLIFLVYYFFILYHFQTKINLIILFLSIIYVVRDFFNITRILSFTNTSSFKDEVLPVIITTFMISMQQIVTSLHLKIDTNYITLLLSLLIIPIYLLYHSFSKFFLNFEKVMQRFEEKLTFDSFYFLIIYFRVLIHFKNYRATEKFISHFLNKNILLSYSEMREKIIPEISKGKNDRTKKNKVKKVVDKRAYKKHIVYFIFIWSIIFSLVIFYNSQIFLNNCRLKVFYIFLFLFLLVDLIINLLKQHKIKCQFDFIIYLFLDALIVIILVIYYFLLPKINFIEANFLMPIFLYFKIKNYYKTQVNFLLIPFKTEYNFFNREFF